MHRYKEYNPSLQLHHYKCEGKKLSWKECTYDQCQVHVKPKVRNHWFPQPTMEECTAPNHNMCRNWSYEVHIAGKRESWVFPGPHMVMFKEQIEKQDWMDCKQNIWTLCFSPECDKHFRTKLEKGYMPTSLFPVEKIYAMYRESKNS